MGIVEVASQLSACIGQRVQAVVWKTWRVSTRIALLFILLCLSPVLVPSLFLLATPIGFLVLVFVHLPRVWRSFLPSPFRRGLAFHREKFGTPLSPSTEYRLKSPDSEDVENVDHEEIATPPTSPASANSDSGPPPAVDAVDLNGAIKQAQLEAHTSASEEAGDDTQSQVGRSWEGRS